MVFDANENKQRKSPCLKYYQLPSSKTSVKFEAAVLYKSWANLITYFRVKLLLLLLLHGPNCCKGKMVKPSLTTSLLLIYRYKNNLYLNPIHTSIFRNRLHAGHYISTEMGMQWSAKSAVKTQLIAASLDPHLLTVANRYRSPTFRFNNVIFPNIVSLCWSLTWAQCFNSSLPEASSIGFHSMAHSWYIHWRAHSSHADGSPPATMVDLCTASRCATSDPFSGISWIWQDT